MAISKITSDAIDATDFNLDSDTLTIDSTNNRVGIGTTFGENTASSANKLAVRSDTGSTHYNIMNIWEHENTSSGIEQRIGWAFGDDGGGESSFGIAGYIGMDKENSWNVDSTRDSAMTFATASNNVVSEHMRIDNSGHQIVGHTSSVGTAFQPNLQVKGSSSSNYGALGVISSNDEMLGLIGVWSHAENSIFIAADPDNLRTNSSIVFTADAVETMRVNGEGLKIRGSSFGLVTNPGQTTITLANNAAINLAVSGTTTAGGGILCVYEPSSGENAVYHVGYNRGNLISNSDGSLFATGSTSGKNTIQVSGHQITFTNRTGSSRGYVFNLFLAGGNAYNQ